MLESLPPTCYIRTVRGRSYLPDSNGSLPSVAANAHNGTPTVRAELAQAMRENPGLATLAYPHKKLDAVDVLDVLISVDGNIAMASHRLQASQQSVMASIVSDENGHALLSRYLRAFTMSKTFGLVARLHDCMVDALDEGELHPRDVAKTLISLVQSMSSLTDTGAAPAVDPFAALMKVLPADEREALRVLAAQAQAVGPVGSAEGEGEGEAAA